MFAAYVWNAPVSAFDECSRAHKGALGAVTMAKGPTDMDTMRRLLDEESKRMGSCDGVHVDEVVHFLDTLRTATYSHTRFLYMRPRHAR